MPQAFQAKHPVGVSLESPQSYRFISREKGKTGETTEDSYRKLNEPDGEMAENAENAGGTIGAILLRSIAGFCPRFSRTHCSRLPRSARTKSAPFPAASKNQATLSHIATGQFIETRRQTHRRRPRHARLLRFTGRLRHSYQPDRHPRAPPSKNVGRFRQSVRYRSHKPREISHASSS